jgi:hypothetical protein
VCPEKLSSANRKLHEELTSDLLPNLQSFASLLDAQPPEVQEASQFLLATAMHEAGKFELVSVAEVRS